MLFVLPAFTVRFHGIGNRYVFWPNIILPLSESNNTRENVARMYSYPHVNIDIMILT